ncbi:DMT family transporter [Roseisalinus antarcticus]|uniref:EamA-like transporter family protein n=1 Tax=Roseisalinus antarcticus TaxID=254357 RepID=A0A1Y5S6I0_9RHOB|nr:DMT family transporter [Roseisalinus antarcticus]SLN32336.1 EamA-like transporter family protein [Roseisalinus antarcticus]
MSTGVFLAVLGAAFLHASWNALIKGGRDKTLGMGALVLGHAPFALAILLVVPLPDPASLPHIAAGLVLHVGYQLCLLESYKIGDLTQVYPIARGTAPLLVALVSVTLLGVHLAPLELLAITVIAAGILSLALVRRADGQRNRAAALLAITTGGFIAGYSLVDGLGARAAGTALGYYAWLSVGNAILTAGYLAWRAPGTLRRIPTDGRRVFLLGGGASYIAYATVIWAFTQAPIALVTALRETSIVFALLLGTLFLRERLDLGKVLATTLTLLGAVLMRLGRL